MDISTIVGVLLGISLMIMSILISDGATFGAFYDLPSILIVGGGATASVLICFPLKTVLSVIGVMKKVILNKQVNAASFIEQIVSLA